MNQIKSDFKQLTGFDLMFVKEASGVYTLILSNKEMSFPLKTELTDPVISNAILISIATTVNALDKTNIPKLKNHE